MLSVSGNPIPCQFNSDGRFQTVPLYVHNNNYDAPDGQSTRGKGDASSIRFLIDLRLSRLGAVQLDGLIHRRQFDMIVRSEQILPDTLTHDLQKTYARTMERH